MSRMYNSLIENKFDSVGVKLQYKTLNRMNHAVTKEDHFDLALDAYDQFESSCEKCVLCGRNADCEHCPIECAFNNVVDTIFSHYKANK